MAIATREVGPSFLEAGFDQSLTKEGRAFIKKNFPEVYERAGGEETIQQLIQGNLWSKIQGKFFLPERFIDQALSRATVMGAYMKEMASMGHDPHSVYNEPYNEKAGARALVTARKVVTSSLRKDAPQALSRGTLTGGSMTLKNAIFQFQSTMLKNAGYAYHEIYAKGIEKGDYLAATTATATMLGVLAAVSALTLGQKEIMSSLTGTKSKDKRDVAEHMKDEMVLEGLRQIPVVGPIATAAFTHAESGIPALDTYIQGASAIGQYTGMANGPYGKPVKGKMKDEALANAITFGATAAGVPGASTVGQYLSRAK